MRPLTLVLLLLLSCALESAQTGGGLPKFEDYRVSERYTGPKAKPVLATKTDREFRTRLRQAAQDNVNFAGHYILTAWGCGAECLMGGAIDAKTGKVYWFPFTICCWPLDVEKPIDFRIDSRLVVFTGSRNEEGQGVYYYRFEDDKFTLVKAIDKPAPVSPGSLNSGAIYISATGAVLCRLGFGESFHSFF